MTTDSERDARQVAIDQAVCEWETGRAATTIRVAASDERSARDIALRLGSQVIDAQQVGDAVWEVTYR